MAEDTSKDLMRGEYGISMYNRYPPIERILRMLIYGSHVDIPSPQHVPPSDYPSPGQPRTLRDYENIGRRSISANIEDRRFEEQPYDWAAIMRSVLPSPEQQAPPQMPGR